jgi:6-phosphogluconolactonase
MVLTENQTTFLSFSGEEPLVKELVRNIGTALDKGINERGKASLLVSGGRTPILLFQALSTAELNWEQVTVSLVDERWCATDQPDSNELLVRTHLLQNRARQCGFIGMKIPAQTAREGEVECERRLQALDRPFDIVILGMGDDGHTASLFPGAPELAAATRMDSGRICMAMTPPHVPYERMSLTLPAILSTLQIFLHITGENKRKVYEKAVAGGPVQEMPIRSILRQKKIPVTVFWAPERGEQGS